MLHPLHASALADQRSQEGGPTPSNLAVIVRRNSFSVDLSQPIFLERAVSSKSSDVCCALCHSSRTHFN